MSLNIGDNFSYLGKKFLDNRQSFDTLELMNNCSDVPIGFITFCKEDNKRYEYTESGWVEYSSSISSEQVEKINAAYNHSQTQHVQPSDLEGFATEEFVTNKIAEAELGGGDVSLNGYVTDEEFQQALSIKYDNVEINDAESNDDQTAIDFYANGEVVKTIYVAKNKPTPPYISTILPENSILGLDETFNIQVDFSSTLGGRGTLKIFINDVEIKSISINQGENTIPVEGSYFMKGNNRITVYATDRSGTMSNSLVFYVRYGSLEVTSDFNPYTSYEPGSIIRYYFTPTAVDTSLALTMYMKIDGELKEGVNCVSDARGTFTFPNNLEVGAHLCEAYIQDSAGNVSNSLIFNLIILDNVSLIVASDTINPVIEEGEQLSLDYKVYMQGNTSFITKTYVNDELINTGTCGLDFAYYKTSSLTEGINVVKIEVYDITETTMDYIIWTVTVTPSTYAMLTPVKTGSMFIGSAQNMTNASENKEVWRGTDQDGAVIDGILRDFTFNSESGWIDDELLISGASSVEIPITPLANNAKYGFTLDLEFASKMIGVSDALVLKLWDDEKNCGIKITTEQVILRSAAGNQADLYFTDDEMTSVMFVIDRNECTAKIYLNGVMCSAFHLSDYSLDGISYLEDFTVNDTIKLGGSGYARVKNLRVYQVALSTDEILNNFMANETRKAEQKALVEFQKGNHLPTLTVYCDFSGLGKDDKKPCAITYVSTDEEKYGKSFTLNHKKSTCQYQGTSSMAYPIKNYRLNLADEKGEKWKYDFPYGKPERRFTLKADFMSSGHWTNTGLTKWINKYLYNYDLDDEKTMNPKKWYDINNGGSIDDTRECIYGFPCRLILVNDGNTPLNEGQNEPTPGNTKDMGIFNFNHDKDATDTMGFDQDIFPNCASYEVTANSDTSAGAFMRYQPPLVPTLYGYKGGSYIITVPLHEITGGQVKCESDGTPNSLNKFLPSGQYYNPFKNTVSFGNDTTMELYFLGDQPAPTWVKINDMMFAVEIVPSSETVNPNLYDYKVEDELDYIKQSFELRFPDEDDVPEGWGFMSIPGEEGTGLKALIDWVDGCTDEEFVRDFDLHFNRDYTLRYFLLVITLGMVDNLGKNMMLDTWDNKIFMPRFYDCDTICSYDNSGQLKFDVDIEMAQGYWNTSTSRLWTRIRDLMHDELVAKYNNMRQNGMSYESFMECFYDEQIAKIPQKYYNMDYDVKYGPFADSYIGMANGDTYEHLKRWLQQRLRFVDTLYDYAPSYNNDVLTIRANTTEPMTLEIETYTPVYQHLSWYNNQMDKKKIDGKTSVSFTGTAMAATDQEVLIYGGSNIKSIKGISSMNPNRMLIGSATRLIELDAPNCPLLADINANKANLAPHLYLNKVNLSGCPLLGGNLIVNQSPLVREIDIRGTAITGLNLPPSLRNLEILRLPAAIQNLVLNDAGQLHTLEFEEGGTLQSVSMTNCNALTNVTNFDLEDATSITLNNSYNTINELYFSKATNLSLSNMASLERVVYTPNAEHEVFDKTNVDNASNYTISTFNCPKLNTFMTTAPYRNSYGKDYGEKKPNEVFEANVLDISSTQFKDVKLLCTTDTNKLLLPRTVKNLVVDSAYDLDIDYLTDGDYDTIHTDLYEPYNSDHEGKHLYNIVPSASDGSLIFSMYAPHNTTEPASGTWDMKGLDFDTFHTFGLNNDIVQAEDGSITMPNRLDGYSYSIDNLRLPNEIANYTASDNNTFPTFNAEFKYSYVVNEQGRSYVYRILADDMDNLPTSISFRNKTSLLTIEYLNVSKVTSADNMFYGCSNLTSLDTSNWDTGEVTNMNGMFYGCNKLTSVDVSNWDTSVVTNMSNIFFNCSGLTSLDTSNWVTNEVTTMYSMFQGCTNLTSLDLSNFDTSNVTSMGYMFYNCTNLTSLDVSNFDTSNVTTMYSMFSNCTNLTSLDVSNFDTSNVTNMGYVFYNCTNLTSLDLSNFDTSKVTSMGYMFYNCSSLQELHIEPWPLNNITQKGVSSLPVGNDAKNIVYTTAYFTVPSGWTLDHALEIIRYTANASGVKPDLKNFTAYSLSEIDNGDGTYTVRISANSLDNLPTSISFYNRTNLLTVEKMNTSKLTDMSSMFQICNNLTYVNTSNWDTSNVTSMSHMFGSCLNLKSLDVSSWNTSKVTNMSNMFNGCSNLTSVDLSNLDCSKVTDIAYMFDNCSSIRTIDLTNTNMKITGFSRTFSGCSNLEEIKYDGWINESMRNYHVKSHSINNPINGCNKLKTDIFMYLCSIYRMSVYQNTDATEPRILDFSGIDTSVMTSIGVGGNTTSIINLHSENGLDLTLRSAKSLTHVDSYHFKWSQYGFKYYGGGGSTLDIIFETTENSTNYKYENWTPGNRDWIIGLGDDSRFTVASIVSFLECLYDYTSKGETTSATLFLGSNLNRLTPEQIAIATNKGWTLT